MPTIRNRLNVCNLIKRKGFFNGRGILPLFFTVRETIGTIALYMAKTVMGRKNRGVCRVKVVQRKPYVSLTPKL